MPKGDFGGKRHILTPEDRKKGGDTTREKYKRKALLSDLISNEFAKPIVVNGVEVTMKDLAAIRLIRTISDPETTTKDFLKALEFARDTIGEKPVDKIMVAEVEQSVIDEVEEMVARYDEGSSD